MKKLIAISLLLFGLNATGVSQHILIYTHNGAGFVHDNIAASVAALEQLAKDNGYTTFVTDYPRYFTPENLAQYDLIIFSNTNNEVLYTEEQRESFRGYIADGGGFMGIHSASGSMRDWPWFQEMIGGKFVRHPELQQFKMKVYNQDHTSVAFLGDEWIWEDECYYLDHLNPDINIVLAADLRTIEDPEKDEFHRNRFGDYTPLAWYHEFEGGRQFYTALGHKSEHYSDPVFLKHLLGGIKWVLDDE